MTRLHRLLVGLALLHASVARGEPLRVPVAAGGRALLPVVVAEHSSKRVQDAARTLADYLGRIADARFDVISRTEVKGIFVGTVRDFPGLWRGRTPGDENTAQRERYLLFSDSRGVSVIGASDLAVENGIWDLLYRLGYRQFFPGPTWEVVPHNKNLSVQVLADETPSYMLRFIWSGYGFWDGNNKPFNQWLQRNRMPGGFIMNTGHSYEGILSRNRATFEAHPEYLSLIAGKRTTHGQFCLSNKGLQALVVADALRHFKDHPDDDSVSVEPNDGEGWCECPACASLGSISDRAVVLANAVSSALEASFPGKYVAMYAYSTHSMPPSIPVASRVLVNVATAFLRKGATVDGLMEAWRRQGVRQIGIREYYSVIAWDRNLPGAARGGDLNYLKETIPHFHQMGARFLTAEAGDNWGPNGLGYYVASRLMWNVDEARNLDAIVDDFLAKAFGTARAPMAEFYRLIDGSGKPKLSGKLIRQMYQLLADAGRSTEDPGIRARLDDLILYTRFVELSWVYKNTLIGRSSAFEAVVRHAYRIRDRMMVHSLGVYRDLPRRDRFVHVPEEAVWTVPEPKNPWKSVKPFTRVEIDAFVTNGVTH